MALPWLAVLPAMARAEPQPFGITLFGGAAAAGGLYTASSTQGDFLWVSPEGKQIGGERLKTSLDENFFLGLRVGSGISDQFSWNVSLAHTQMNVSADVLTVARNSDSYNWDTAHATFYEAALMWDWTKQKNAPYFLAGIGAARVHFKERTDTGGNLEQNGVCYVLGGGYRWDIVRFEARDHLVPTDFSAEGERLQAESFDGKSLLQFWEISVGIFMNF
jgi:hypothetical protein